MITTQKAVGSRQRPDREGGRKRQEAVGSVRSPTVREGAKGKRQKAEGSRQKVVGRRQKPDREGGRRE